MTQSVDGLEIERELSGQEIEGLEIKGVVVPRETDIGRAAHHEIVVYFGHDDDQTFDDFTTSAANCVVRKDLSALHTARAAFPDIDHGVWLGSDVLVNDEVKIMIKTPTGSVEIYRGYVDFPSAVLLPDGTEQFQIQCVSDKKLRTAYLNYNQCIHQNVDIGRYFTGSTADSHGIAWSADSDGNYPDGILYQLGFSYDGPDSVFTGENDIVHENTSFLRPIAAINRVTNRLGYEWYTHNNELRVIPKSPIQNFETISYEAVYGHNLNKFDLGEPGDYDRDALLLLSQCPYPLRSGSGAEKSIDFYILDDANSRELDSAHGSLQRFYPFITASVYTGDLTIEGCVRNFLGKYITVSHPQNLFTGIGNVNGVQHDVREDRWGTTLRLEDPERSDAQSVLDLEEELRELREANRETNQGRGLYYIDDYTEPVAATGFLLCGFGLGTNSIGAQTVTPEGLQDIFEIDDKIGDWCLSNITRKRGNYHWGEIILFGNDTGYPYDSTKSYSNTKAAFWNINNDEAIGDDWSTVTQSLATWNTDWNVIDIATYSFDSAEISISSSFHTLAEGSMVAKFGWKDYDTTSYSTTPDWSYQIPGPTDPIWASASNVEDLSENEKNMLSWDYYSKSDTGSFFTHNSTALTASDNERWMGMMFSITLPGQRKDYQSVKEMRMFAVGRAHYHQNHYYNGVTSDVVEEVSTLCLWMWDFRYDRWEPYTAVAPASASSLPHNGSCYPDRWVNHARVWTPGGSWDPQSFIGPGNQIHFILSTIWGADRTHGATMSVAYSECALVFDDKRLFMDIAEITGDNNELLTVKHPVRYFYGVYTASDDTNIFEPEGDNLAGYDNYPITYKDWGVHGSPQVLKIANAFEQGKRNYPLKAFQQISEKHKTNYDWYDFIDEVYEQDNSWDKNLFVTYVPEDSTLDSLYFDRGWYMTRSEDGSTNDKLVFYKGETDTEKVNYNRIPYYVTASVVFQHVGYDGDFGGDSSTGGIRGRITESVGVDKNSNKTITIQARTASV